MTSNSNLKTQIRARQVITGEKYNAARQAVLAYAHPELAVGQRLRFRGDRTSFTVRALSEDRRFAICTRADNLRRPGYSQLSGLQYTIMDFALGIRGTDNMIFGYGYDTDEDVALNLARLVDGEMEVSWRNWVWLRFTDTQPDKTTQAMLPELREVIRRAPARQQNDHDPRSPEELPA